MKRVRTMAIALFFVLIAAIPPRSVWAQVPAPATRLTQAVLLAPDRLKRGDPLLLWVFCARPLEGAEAALFAADGRRLMAAAAFVGPEYGFPAPAGAQATQPQSGGDLFIRSYGFLMAIPFDLPQGTYRAIVKEPVASARGAEAAASVDLVASIRVESRMFPSEDIGLDAANTKLRTETDIRKEEEARRLGELLGRVDDDAVYLDGSSFMMPLVPKRKSAGFGDKRRYLYAGGGSDSSIHAGLDLAVATGTPVSACAPGRVVMVAERIVTGNTVVVEHLPGLFSLYMHLSTISVAEGQLVDRGTQLGLSGSTGLSTGPHLHWELRARGQAVDPEYWLSRPPLDKDRVAAIIVPLIEGR
jgi:murein DD-endopeptidase MepM/ murein hydrolase activator NlpD